MSFGITPQGVNIKTLEILLEEIDSNMKSLLGNNFDTSPDTPQGQIIGIMADKIAELWEAYQALYASRTRDGAEGAGLDDIGALLNLPRLGATNSTVTLYLHLDGGTTVAAGEIVSIGLTGAQWITTQSVTSTTPGFYPVEAQSVDTGVIIGNAYSIDTIVSPIGGWDDRAAVYSANTQPFDLRPYQTLLIEVDGSDPVTVIFKDSDFSNITAATDQEVIDAIKAKIPGVDGDANGTIKLFSNTGGTGSSIRIAGGTANPSLGFRTMLVEGMNPNQPAQLISTLSETFNMSSNETLFVSVDGNTAQPIGFNPTDFGYPAVGSISTVQGNSLTHGESFTVFDGASNVQFVFDQTNSFTASTFLIPVPYVGTESAQQMRDLMITAINSSLLNVVATATPEAEDLIITNSNVGASGNVNILKNVANTNFKVDGMAYGSGSTSGAATAAQIARAINTQANGFLAYASSGKVILEATDSVGFNSRLEVTGGSANLILGFPLESEVAGINGAAEVGREDERDPAYRLRQQIIDSSGGNATYDAMRSALLQVTGVVQAFVFDNETDFVDAFGRPAHSFEAVVLGGTDAEVSDAIFITKPLGIQSYAAPGVSGVTVGVVNSQGNTIPIKFSRPDTVTMYVEVDVLVDATFGNGDQILGEQTVKQAIKDIGDTFNIGQDLVILLMRCAPLNVTGVKDVTSIRVDSVNPPVNQSNIVISERSLAFFSTLNISVNVTYQ